MKTMMNKSNIIMQGNLRKFLLAGLLCLLICVVYANSLNNKFTNWDDNSLIVNNTAIRNLSLSSVKKIFEYHFKGGTYQPVRVFSYAIDYHFWKLNPLGYHIHNILLHMIASVFLFFSLLKALPRLITAKVYGSTLAAETSIITLAFMTSTLFAVHPVSVESVTWLSSRKYVLLAAFSFISFYFYLKSTDNDSFNIRFTILSIFCFFAAAFSSPFGVVLPAFFFLFEFCCEPEGSIVSVVKKRYRSFFPYLFFGIAVFLMLWIRLTGSGGAETFHFQHSAVKAFTSMMQVFFDYIKNFLCPLWLNNRYVDYVYLHFFDCYKVPSGTILFVASFVVSFVLALKGKRLMLFEVGWFILFWLPASNIIPISTKMADRYVYLASPGFYLLFSLFILKAGDITCRVFAGAGAGGVSHMQFIKRQGHFVSLSLFFIITAWFMVLSFQRNMVWKNSGTLWTDSIKKDKLNYLAYNNLGTYQYNQGNVDEATKSYIKSLLCVPDNMMALQNLSATYMEKGQHDKAAIIYKKMLSIEPDNVLANSRLGYIYSMEDKPDLASEYFAKVLKKESANGMVIGMQGDALVSIGKIDQAVDILKKGINLFPDDARLYYSLAHAYEKKKDFTRALALFLKACKLKPLFFQAFNEAGLMYHKIGKDSKAVEYYKKALKVNAGFASAYNNLGNIFFYRGNLNKAKDKYTKALEINHNLMNARFNMCVIYEKQGITDKAFSCYESVIKKDPDHAEAKNNMGSILFKRGKLKQAERLFKQAASLKENYSEPYFNLGLLFEQKGENQKAVEAYQSARNIKPDDMEILNKLFKLLMKTQKYKQALSVYLQILNKYPGNSDAYYNLGVIYAKLGKNLKAYNCFKTAAELDPENKMAVEVLKRIKIEKK